MPYRVADNDFNRAWYKDEIGKIYGGFRGYMLMQEICRPTRAEWRAMWRFTRVFSLNAKNVEYASPSLRLAIEALVMRELAKLKAGMPTDHQQRVALLNACRAIQNHS